MSEVAPDRCPDYCRKVPEKIANEKINELVRAAIKESVASAKAGGYATREEYTDAVSDKFYEILGKGVIETNIELIVKDYPDEYVARMKRSDTAFRRHSRADYRSNAHPSVLSPIIALTNSDSSNTFYAGTDKLGHMMQQGYDEFDVFTTVEAKQKGMGRLFAVAWGYWSEGEELSDEFIENYLRTNNLPSSEGRIESLKKEINHFLTDSETIEYVSPTPSPIKDITPLRKISHFIGAVDFGCLGLISNGIVSYADIVANEAGLKFYLDLEKDPEYLAENFDIANYATSNWDEEILKSRYTPQTEKRVKEAVDGEWLPSFVYGIGADYEFFKNRFVASMPFLYYPHDNFELRLRAGVSAPIPDAQLSLDTSVRISGLLFSTVSVDVPMRDLNPRVKIGPEIMALGRGSFGLYYAYGLRDQTSSMGFNFLALWR